MPALALALASLAALAALALFFPQHLTTPELAWLYSTSGARATVDGAVFVVAVLGGALALLALIRTGAWVLSGFALALAGLATTLVAHAPTGRLMQATSAYVGLDWLLIDLIASALLFVTTERACALRRDQRILREGWSTDLSYFVLNHLAVGLVLIAANGLANHAIGPLLSPDLKASMRKLPLWAAVPLILVLADLVQYGLHRAYHAHPLLWRIHSVHHSVETMDWLAGSRQHLLELLMTRVLGLAPLIALGFDKAALDVAIAIAMVQAVLNHANVQWPRAGSRLAWLRFAFVTPHFHHWHHAREEVAHDKNFAALFSFIDHLFGTAIDSPGRWPQRYGVDVEQPPRVRAEAEGKKQRPATASAGT